MKHKAEITTHKKSIIAFDSKKDDHICFASGFTSQLDYNWLAWLNLQILNFIYRSEILLHISFESKYCNDCNPVALSLDVTRAQQVDTRYSTQTQKFWSYSNLTRTKHYSDRVVSSINSRNFRIISTIIQKQPVMEKIFQDKYSKTGYFLFNTFLFYQI